MDSEYYHKNYQQLEIKDNVAEVCKQIQINNTSISTDKNPYYFMRSSKQNLLMCAAQNIFSKQQQELLYNTLEKSCGQGSLKACTVSDNYAADNNTLRIIILRHPFDRLIMHFKQKKLPFNDKVPQRKILFSRYRKSKMKKKISTNFRQFVLTSVLSNDSVIEPISQVRF